MIYQLALARQLGLLAGWRVREACAAGISICGQCNLPTSVDRDAEHVTCGHCGNHEQAEWENGTD